MLLSQWALYFSLQPLQDLKMVMSDLHLPSCHVTCSTCPCSTYFDRGHSWPHSHSSCCASGRTWGLWGGWGADHLGQIQVAQASCVWHMGLWILISTCRAGQGWVWVWPWWTDWPLGHSQDWPCSWGRWPGQWPTLHLGGHTLATYMVRVFRQLFNLFHRIGPLADSI